MSDEQRMFDKIKNPCAITWNVIVRRYLEVGEGKKVASMFVEMIKMDVRLMSFTVSNALVAYSSFKGINEGIQIHEYAIKSNMELNEVILGSLVNMYVRCGNVESARRTFELPSSKDLINWTSMVSGNAMSGITKEAMALFDEMPEQNVISWNAMFAGYMRSFQWDEALDFFMIHREIKDISSVTLGLG